MSKSKDFSYARATRMHRVLVQYQRERGETMPTNNDDLQDLLVDVLADLRHWAAGASLYEHGAALDFDKAASTSLMHFAAETSEQ